MADKNFSKFEFNSAPELLKKRKPAKIPLVVPSFLSFVLDLKVIYYENNSKRTSSFNGLQDIPQVLVFCTFKYCFCRSQSSIGFTSSTLFSAEQVDKERHWF